MEIRDRFNALQTRLLELATAAGAGEVAPARTFRLGQRVIHMNHGYRGVICGCEPRLDRAVGQGGAVLSGLRTAAITGLKRRFAQTLGSFWVFRIDPGYQGIMCGLAGNWRERDASGLRRDARHRTDGIRR